MKRRLLQHLLAVCIGISAAGKAGAQAAPAFKWNELPVRGLLLSVPAKQDVPMFCDFIRTALVKEGVNTLAIRIEYMYQFKSHPELAEKNALSEAEMKQIVRACRDAKT